MPEYNPNFNPNLGSGPGPGQSPGSPLGFDPNQTAQDALPPNYSANQEPFVPPEGAQTFYSPPTCMSNPTGPTKVYYYNGYLYWDARVTDNTLMNSFLESHYSTDLVRGMSNMVWSYDPDKPAHPYILGPLTGRFHNLVSYNDYSNKKPEVITIQFAKSHPDDNRPSVIYGVRVISPYGDLVENVGGTYPVTVIPATVNSNTPIVVNGQLVGYQDPTFDGIVTVNEINSPMIYAPYERETKGWQGNDGWKSKGLKDGIPPIPYNKETLILRTSENILQTHNSNVEQFPKEKRFAGSAFLRLIQKIIADDQAMSDSPAPQHHAVPFKNDHNYVCELPWKAPSEHQQQKVAEQFAHYIDIDTRYNYYNENYEYVTGLNFVDEPLLPSLLITAAEELSDPANKWDYQKDGDINQASSLTKLKQNLTKFITLNGNIPFVSIDNFSTKAKDPQEKSTNTANTGKEKDKGQYLEKWSSEIRLIEDITLENPEDHFRLKFARATAEEFRSQIILPDLKIEKQLDFGVGQSSTGADTSSSTYSKFSNNKDPLSYEGRKFMFPAYTEIKIGTHAEKQHRGGETNSLLNCIIRYDMVLPLLRAIQERVDDLTFNKSRNVGSLKQFWAENRKFIAGPDPRLSDGGWDSFTIQKSLGTKTSHDYSVENTTANLETRGNDLFFYRNPYPYMRPQKPNPDPNSGNSVRTHRSWLHHYFMEGAGAYDKLPSSDAFPGEVSGLIAASHGEDTDVAFGMELLINEEQETSTMAALQRKSMVNSLISDVNKIAREKTRTLEQICIDSTTACDETLFWRIEKIKIKSDGAEEKIQNFYLLNDPTKNELDFVDTQVKYGGKYKYRIYAWKAVFGTETEYQFPRSYIADPGNADSGVLAQTMLEAKLQGCYLLPFEKQQQCIDDANAEFVAAIQAGDTDAFPESFASDEELAAAGITDLLNEPTLVSYDQETWQLILDALSYPSIRIVETFFHETEPQLISDRPPLPPMMEVHPYRGINDTYLVRLNAASGESVKAIPQIIMPEDVYKFMDNYISQHGSGFNEYLGLVLAEASGYDIVGSISQEQAVDVISGLNMPLTFRSDDPPKEFEVFMLGPDPETGSPRPPKSYIDFANGERIVLPIEHGTSTSFRPEIIPNKKYYYTFRSTDIHGNISFPSKIYQIELVDDSGAIYMLTNTYEFPEPKKVMKKDVRKFMNIIPSSAQTVFAPPADGSYINFTPVMGDLFESNKRYKFRLTSKKTGKKLDINVKVKMTKRKTEDEKTS